MSGWPDWDGIPPSDREAFLAIVEWGPLTYRDYTELAEAGLVEHVEAKNMDRATRHTVTYVVDREEYEMPIVAPVRSGPKAFVATTHGRSFHEHLDSEGLL